MSSDNKYIPSSEKVWSMVLLVRIASLAMDPIFFFALAVMSGGGGVEDKPCIFLDSGVVKITTILRTWLDVMHVWYIWTQFQMAYVANECGKSRWDTRTIIPNVIRCLSGSWLDILVILPIPQVIYGLVVPNLMSANRIDLVMGVLQFSFWFQFIPKIYHVFQLKRKMDKATGFIFGTIWWGFGLSLVVYFLASNASGGYWYLLAIQRVASCLGNTSSTCTNIVPRNSSTINQKSFCLDKDGPYPFGVFKSALPIVSGDAVLQKILYSNIWGFTALSTKGKYLEPEMQYLELIFAMTNVLFGVLLLSLFIGCVQVFRNSDTMNRIQMQQRFQATDQWMERRVFPSHLRSRIRQSVCQRWETMAREDEFELIKDYPVGLRRDIKRFLCLDLIKMVPLFGNLDSIILDNIIDRLKPVAYSRYEKIIREGDIVEQIIFIANGSVKRRHNSINQAATLLERGSLLGDELLTWIFRRPFIHYLPNSSATFICTTPVDAFALKADDLKFVTDFFRYGFDEKLKRSVRCYSINWRTWAAIYIQRAWRRRIRRRRGDERCANYFLSLKPRRPF